MPIAGRKPTPEGQPKRNTNPTLEWTEVEEVPFEGPWPDLPATYSDAIGEPEKDERWAPLTKRWWNTIKRLPHAKLWGDTEWEIALAGAIVHHRFLRGNASAATEIRRREAALGATADARRDLRIRYVAPSDGPKLAKVTAMDSVRDL